MKRSEKKMIQKQNMYQKIHLEYFHWKVDFVKINIEHEWTSLAFFSLLFIYLFFC